MKDSNFFLRPEDEMDFIPIIPLNENDGETGDGTDIPDELPVIPLRNTVLFPGVVLPITVGRDKSIKAVNDAYKADKLIGVVAQKDSNVENAGWWYHRYYTRKKSVQDKKHSFR